MLSVLSKIKKNYICFSPNFKIKSTSNFQIMNESKKYGLGPNGPKSGHNKADKKPIKQAHYFQIHK